MGFADLKLPKIKVPTELPSPMFFPLAVVYRPEGETDWHFHAVVRGKNDGWPIMATYFAQSPPGTWALVDRETGMVVDSWEHSS